MMSTGGPGWAAAFARTGSSSAIAIARQHTSAPDPAEMAICFPETPPSLSASCWRNLAARWSEEDHLIAWATVRYSLRNLTHAHPGAHDRAHQEEAFGVGRRWGEIRGAGADAEGARRTTSRSPGLPRARGRGSLWTP